MSDNKLGMSEEDLPLNGRCGCSDQSDFFCVCEHEAVYNSSMEGKMATIVEYYSTAEENVFKYVNESGQAEVDLYYFYANEQFAILWILFLLIVLGNSAVLIALFLEKKRKSRMNFFIMQLALADLTVGVFYVLTDIIWRMTVAWHAGNLGCKIIRFLQAVVIYSSTYVLVALSIDRYDAITHPMNFSGSSEESLNCTCCRKVNGIKKFEVYEETNLQERNYVPTDSEIKTRRARVLVILAWFFSVVFSIPIVIFYEEKYVQKKLQCWIDFDEPWQWQLYLTLISVALFFLPAIIISACYTIIVFTIWSKGKLLTHPSAYKSGSKLCKWSRENGEEMDSRRASSRGLIPRAKIKTVKMTFAIVFVFILCWSPYFIFDLLQVYGYFPTNQESIATASFIQSLAPLNSAANPLIYCAFSTHFCRALRKIPPFRWFISMADSSDKSFGSATVTESLTSRRSGMSLRHHNHIKLHADEHQITEAAVTAV